MKRKAYWAYDKVQTYKNEAWTFKFIIRFWMIIFTFKLNLLNKEYK